MNNEEQIKAIEAKIETILKEADELKAEVEKLKEGPFDIFSDERIECAIYCPHCGGDVHIKVVNWQCSKPGVKQMSNMPLVIYVRDDGDNDIEFGSVCDFEYLNAEQLIEKINKLNIYPDFDGDMFVRVDHLIELIRGAENE